MSRDVDVITDHELVARIRAGDDRAFECLYRRYHRRIASYIQGMVHDHARAEDLAQDVFMSALRRMRDTDRPIAFKPWIYEIAKNACIDQFRRSRRAEEVSYDADDGLGSADYGRLVTKDPSPEVRYETKQQLDHLRGAFGGLSETHHEILVMRELEGLSYREIGERLGMTRPAVESTLFRARRRLTEEYEELVTGERCRRVQGIISTAGAGALGARDRRRVARHVSYCQPCLRQARAAGMDAADLVARPLRAKVAALLPLPAFLKARLGGPNADAAAAPNAASLGSWSAQIAAVDPGIVSSWGKAAATAATIAVAGVGAGVAANPPASVQAALGSPISDRLGGDGASASSAAGADREPAGPGAARSPAAVAPSSGSAPGRRTVTRRSLRRSAGARSGARTSSDRSDAPARAPRRDASERTDRAAGGELSDTLSRLGGTASSGTTAAAGTVGAPNGSAVPLAPLPKPDAPSLAAPAPATSQDAPEAVSNDSTIAESVISDAVDAAEGILAGE